MGEQFTVQISSDLVRRLACEHDQKPIRKPKGRVVRLDLPSKNQGSQIKAKAANFEKSTKDIGGWQPGLPSLLPEGVFPHVANKELDPLCKVIDESGRVVEKLQNKEARMLDEVKRKARELHEKEYRMPEKKPMPCTNAKDACVQCYEDHPQDPLQCAEVVKAFVDCARQVQRQFVTSAWQ